MVNRAKRLLPFRALMHEGQKHRDEQRLERMLLEGLESEPGITVGTPEWDEFWKKIRARIGAKRT